MIKECAPSWANGGAPHSWAAEERGFRKQVQVWHAGWEEPVTRQWGHQVGSSARNPSWRAKMWKSKAGEKRRKWGLGPRSFRNPCSWGVEIRLDGVKSRKKTRRKWHQKSRCERISRRLDGTREAPSGDSAAALPGPIVLRDKLMLLWLDYELISREGEFTLTLRKPMFT